MELQQAIEKRQSIRRYREGDIPDAHMEEIVAAAVLAPSAKNEQNWHFIVVKNKDVIHDIADMVIAKNESIAVEIEKVDPAEAGRFRKFSKSFTVFWRDSAPVLTAVFGAEYIPDGYREYQLIGAEQAVLDDLKLRRNPGMQGIGCAIENFILKAIEKGYGSTLLTSPNYAAPEIEAYFKENGIFHEEGFFLVSMIATGIPQENQKSPRKKPLEEMYTLVR